MPTRRPGSAVLMAALVTGFVAGLIAAAAGLVLADLYRPHPQAGFIARVPSELRQSDRWRDWHLWADVACFFASLLALALAARCRSLIVAICAAVAVLTAAVTLVTRELVAWDQLALRSVTAGTDLSGYWPAAFGDDVVFVLVDGSEVSQTTYAAVLLVHLAAPVLGAVALLTAAIAVRRAPPEDRAPEPVAPYAGVPAA